MITLQMILAISVVVFGLGLAIAMMRSNAILILVGVELMLGAANLNFIAFWRFGPNPEMLTGVMFALFSIAIAAAEAGVGLALILLIYRNYRTVKVNNVTNLQG